MRYGRQILIREVGTSGQAHLKNARVLCVGMGGLGCPASLYLTGAGIGTLGLIDADVVSESNLHRQILYSGSQVGQKKVDAAKTKLQALNSEVEFITHAEDLTAKNAGELFSNYDLILDGTDRFETKLLINDTCLKLNLPWVYASVAEWDGQIAFFDPREKGSACYRCYRPEMPKIRVQNCAESGVIGPVAGILGTQQALTAIQALLPAMKPLVATLRIFEGHDQAWTSFKLIPNPHCAYCLVPREQIILKDEGEVICDALSIGQVSADELKKSLPSVLKTLTLIDVREDDEWDEFHIEGALHWPLNRLEKEEFPAIAKDRKILVYCRSGKRSKTAAALLKNFGFQSVIELKDGLSSW